MAYIKDSAIACLEKMFCELIANSDKISKIKAVFLKNYVIPTLEASKTDDVEEVKHGKWLHKKTDELNYYVYGQCSNCLERKRVDNYCPNCGAKMDEEQK